MVSTAKSWDNEQMRFISYRGGFIARLILLHGGPRYGKTVLLILTSFVYLMNDIKVVF